IPFIRYIFKMRVLDFSALGFKSRIKKTIIYEASSLIDSGRKKNGIFDNRKFEKFLLDVLACSILELNVIEVMKLLMILRVSMYQWPILTSNAKMTRFSSNSTKQLSNAIVIKNMIVACDYGEIHNMVKRHIFNSMLGPNGQRYHHGKPVETIESLSEKKTSTSFVN
ncbi:ent-kaurene oxidase, partial [Striga asiatica]